MSINLLFCLRCFVAIMTAASTVLRITLGFEVLRKVTSMVGFTKSWYYVDRQTDSVDRMNVCFFSNTSTQLLRIPFCLGQVQRQHAHCCFYTNRILKKGRIYTTNKLSSSLTFWIISFLQDNGEGCFTGHSDYCISTFWRRIRMWTFLGCNGSHRIVWYCISFF